MNPDQSPFGKLRSDKIVRNGVCSDSCVMVIFWESPESGVIFTNFPNAQYIAQKKNFHRLNNEIARND